MLKALMKKLYFAGAGIALLLLFSLWAKNANFNLRTMMQPMQAVNPTATTTTPNPQTGGNVPIEILITITPNGFIPDVIMIKPGTKITWVNKSGKDANINSDPHPAHTNYPSLNLGNFWNNGSVSLIFTQHGRFGYHNDVAPSQHGYIIVQ